jgi:hypothetical protein
MSERLIKEFNEFNLQRMNSDSTPMAMHVDNPELSMDAFDKHVDNIRSANIRLNGILNTLANSGGVFNMRKDKMEDGLDIKNLKILRMYISNDINLDIYISFVISDTEYYGVIKNFMDENPVVYSEAFRDPQMFASKEWIIKIKGILIKTIEKWMIVEPGKYQALKEIKCTTEDTGELVELKAKTKFEVIRNYDYDKIIIDVNGTTCALKGMNFYYFNYWFKKVD